MYGAIPASLILELARQQNGGLFQQIPIDFDLPMIEVKEEYLTSINKEYKIDGMGILSSIDHPSFTHIRDWLFNNGYIHKETGWCNGDYTLKPFYFNNVYFGIDDKFPSAGAMKGHLKFKNSVDSEW